ncbi:MAG: S1C family serine protease [Nitrospirales bacterium]
MRRQGQRAGWWSLWLLVLGATPVPAGPTEAPTPAAIEHATQATVGILRHGADGGEETGTGRVTVRASGIHIGDRYIVTARHAVAGGPGDGSDIPKEIQVLTTNLAQVPATLVGVDRFLDLAVYRVAARDVSALRAATAFAESEAAPGEEVFTVGYPLGWGPAVAFGRIGNPHVFLPTVETRLVQVDLSACRGNSGGGLFNGRGELVGLVHAIIQTESTQGDRRCSRFAFAVPRALAYQSVTALIEGRSVGFSRLGVQMDAVKVGTQWRVAVARAIDPARAAGLQKGDILLAIEDVPITDAAQLKTYLLEHTAPGQRVAVRILRGDREQVIYVTLGRA